MGLVVLVIITTILLAKKSGDSARAHKMGRKSFKQRNTDKKKLSRHEKKLLAQSKQFIAQKRYLQAARLLEQIKMERDAITLLEKSGHIHEAAHMLLRMRRPNRAGVVYARNHYYTNAAESFIKAGMPLEAAQCARSAGDHKLAAAAFEKVGEFAEAAQSYVAIGAFINAARCYYKANQIDSAMASYKKKFIETENFNYKTLTPEDQSYITTWLSAGNYDESIAEAAKRTDLLTKIITALAASGHYQNIGVLTPFCEIPDFNRIMSKINYEDASAKTLAHGFKEAKEYERAGMIFEQLSIFQDAAECFEKISDFDRASYLWGRAGNDERSNLAKQKANEFGASAKRKSNDIKSGFSLGENGSDMAKADDAVPAIPTDSPLNNLSSPASEQSPATFSLNAQDSVPDSDASKKNVDISGYVPTDFSSGNNTQAHETDPGNVDLTVFDGTASVSNPPSQVSDDVAPKTFFQANLWVDLTGVECQKIWDKGETVRYGKG